MYHEQGDCQSPPPKKTKKVEGKGLNLELCAVVFSFLDRFTSIGRLENS